MSGSALSDLSGLLSLARERDLDLRPVILRVQTDLFATAKTRDPATIASYEALATGLLPAVDDDTAAIVARKLAPVPEAPESILCKLAARGGEARRVIVETAHRLSAALVAAASRDGADLSVLRAARADLAWIDIDELVAREDADVDLALAGNPQARLSGFSLQLLVDRARGDRELAHALLARPELPASDAAALYLHADDARRALIRGDVAALATLRSHGLRQPDEDLRADLLAHAAAQDAEAFGRTLSAMLRLEAQPSWSFEREERHDLLPLALSAAGLGEEDVVRILLTFEPSIALSVQEVFRLVRLLRATTRETAVYLVEAIVGARAGKRARHVPQLQEGDPRLFAQREERRSTSTLPASASAAPITAGRLQR